MFQRKSRSSIFQIQQDTRAYIMHFFIFQVLSSTGQTTRQ